MKRDIAIDGPSGCGKTTVGMCTAGRLGLVFVDSGLLYRVFTAAYIVRYPGDAALQMKHLKSIIAEDISYGPDGRILIDGDEPPILLHDPRVDGMVSPVSAVSDVRAAVNRELRRIAGLQDVVMVGRDIGTTVLPHAFLKVFMTAAPDVRARRRVHELALRGISAEYDDVLANIRQRDVIDSSRLDSPLRCDETYIQIDNSTDGSEEVVRAILTEYRRRLGDAV